METIGGYFGLELREGEHYHKNAMRLNTARNCFEYILRTRDYVKVYIPYYTCEVMFEPIQKLGINYEFYHLNKMLEPTSTPKLGEKEAFLYTNYFGLKQDCAKSLASDYGKQLIVDNAQAFYAEPLVGIDTFYSARKFFGVPDGAYLYTDKPMCQNFEQDCSYGRMSHLLKRIDLGAEEGYQDFCKNDNALCNQGIKRMSELTETLLSGIDYEKVGKKRRENYRQLDEALKDKNKIHLNIDKNDVPLVYLYLTNDISLRQKLIDNKVFVATYWPNVKGWVTSGTLEYELVDKLIPIPCDQRLGIKDIKKVLSLIKS
jgi:hypothetical protein